MKRIGQWVLIVVGAVAGALLWPARGLVLYNAACVGQATAVRALLWLAIDVNADADPGSNSYALSCAAARGHTEVVKLLLAAGAHPNLSCCGATAIGFAAHAGHLDVVRVLLAAGANPNEGGPLGAAAWRGDREMVRVLLDAGASPAYDPDAGHDAAQAARKAGHEEVARMMEDSRR